MADREIQGLAEAVAAKLTDAGGGAWTARAENPEHPLAGVYLEGPNGGLLFLRVDWRNKARVAVSGEANPRPEYGSIGWGHSWPSIGVASGRGPEAIAREIGRRLLPDYWAALAKYLEVMAAHNRRETATAAVRARLAAELGGAGCQPDHLKGEL